MENEFLSGREVEGRMWEFESCTGKTLVVTDDEIKKAYNVLFPIDVLPTEQSRLETAEKEGRLLYR